jgi:ParB family chromosome partitioning protein
MNMFEEAQAICGMIDMCSATQKEIAEKLGVSQSYIANKVRLLSFPEDIRELILKCGLTERHARALLRLKDSEEMRDVIQKIKAMHLTVAETEALIEAESVSAMPKKIAATPAGERLCFFEEILKDSVKNLASCGIKVRTSYDFLGNMRLITLCIEE